MSYIYIYIYIFSIYLSIYLKIQRSAPEKICTVGYELSNTAKRNVLASEVKGKKIIYIYTYIRVEKTRILGVLDKIAMNQNVLQSSFTSIYKISESYVR